MKPENSGGNIKVTANEPKAKIWLMLDLLMAPFFTILFTASDYNSIYNNLLFFGLLFIFVPILVLIRHPFSNDKNVINLYLDLFSGDYAQFPFFHKLCLMTLVIVDAAGLVMIIIHLFINSLTYINNP